MLDEALSGLWAEEPWEYDELPNTKPIGLRDTLYPLSDKHPHNNTPHLFSGNSSEKAS